jgi:hypothetical protein
MNLFKRLFGNKEPASAQPDIRFGRHSDNYRNSEQNEAFEQALRDFEQEQYQSSYISFFNYLRDDREENVRAWEENGDIKFEIYQGSKRVAGFANAEKVYAEAKIAKVKTLQSSFMRRLLEENYELKYARFVLTPDEEIAVVFDSYVEDGSPYKLYWALKELALYADKHDDLLIDEFSSLEPLDVHVRRQLPVEEKEIKYTYIKREIEAVFKEMDEGKLKADQYPMPMTYLLLGLCFKLDYLTKPEGYMMEALERIYRLAFAQDGKNAAQKNQHLRKEFKKLIERPKEKFFNEMYEVRATFGITSPIDHQKVSSFIDTELPQMKWYYEHGHEKLALAFPFFIAGSCLFYYAPPPPDRAFFHLLIQILEDDFFMSLGFQSFFKNGQLDEQAVRKSIHRIADSFKNDHPKLNPDTKRLVFKSLPEFAESYLYMVRDLDLTQSG